MGHRRPHNKIEGDVVAMVSGGRSRERVVVFGLEGVGKSEVAMDVAVSVLGEGETLFVIDNDNAWDRMLEGVSIVGEAGVAREEYRWVENARGVGSWVEDTDWVDPAGNIVVFHVEGGWESNISAIAEVKRRAGRDDWCCIDSGSALWDDVQAWFTQTVFSSSMADYFMQVRMKKAEAEKEAKALGALDGWVDWPVINAAYKEGVMKFLTNPPCHLVVCCEQADVSKEENDKETRALYRENVKPRGQKRLGHNVQTVLKLRRDQGGFHYADTVKDRGGREKLVKEDVTGKGFSEWYLAEVAGWTEWDGEASGEVEEPEVKSAPVIAKKG